MSLLDALLFLNALIISMVQYVEPIRCYCTDDHCTPFGVCESNVCVVGLLRSTNTVIRMCGNEIVRGCQRDLEKWTDLCACDSDFCNTFTYLRANSLRERTRTNRDGEDLVFERVDPPLGDFSGFDSFHDDEMPLSTRTSLLTLVLVIVPLSVGAATVLVVAFNYYCHLC